MPLSREFNDQPRDIYNRPSEARPPPNHLGLDFHISIYTYVSNTRVRVSDLR